MMKKIILAFAICLLLGSFVTARAEEIDLLKILTKKSDIIVLGKVIKEMVRYTAHQFDGSDDSSGEFEIAIEDVIKGSPIKNNKISGAFDVKGESSPLKAGEKTILFLDDSERRIDLLGKIETTDKENITVLSWETYLTKGKVFHFNPFQHKKMTINDCIKIIKKYIAQDKDK